MNKGGGHKQDQPIILDNIHSEHMHNIIKDETTTIPTLKRERARLKSKLSRLPVSNSISAQLTLTDAIQRIDDQIQALRDRKKKYYISNATHIFDYFETTQLFTTSLSVTMSESASAKLQSFFQPKQSLPPGLNGLETTRNTGAIKKYLTNINSFITDMDDYTVRADICPVCSQGTLVSVESDGILMCNQCFVDVPYLIENEKISYKEAPKEVSFYAYKKINHFKEILAQFQGKETTTIPDELIERIKAQIEKEHIDAANLTYYRMKDLLKSLGYNKYYEHIAYIKNKLGIKPPVFTAEFEETLCNLFLEIQGPHSAVCPESRINFLSYHYVMYKLCEKCGQTQYLKDIPLLKDPEKIIGQDETWKKICEHPSLNWTFVYTTYPTQSNPRGSVLDMFYQHSTDSPTTCTPSATMNQHNIK